MDIASLLWLLLPVAALSGWLSAQHSLNPKKQEKATQKLSPDYLQGLNYLLNEQPDKAVDIFIKLLTVDNDTVETHLALGALFRRRGEVNRAIRIHQNLIERKQLSCVQREQAVMELGRDYLRAGLLDRAEYLYHELIESSTFGVYACQQLLEIYQQEKDWQKAIKIAQKLDNSGLNDYKPMMAQFYCEQAHDYQQQQQLAKSQALLYKALEMDKRCVRANLLLGWMAIERQQFKLAIAFFQQIEQQNPHYLAEVVEPLHLCYRALQQQPTFIAYLHDVLQKQSNFVPIQPLVQFIKDQEGELPALAFVTEHLKKHPTLQGMAYFLNLTRAKAHANCQLDLNLLQQATLQLLKNNPDYQCEECGFAGKTLHWQCPRCKQWNTVKPI